jgi:hypothetical protein
VGGPTRGEKARETGEAYRKQRESELQDYKQAGVWVFKAVPPIRNEGKIDWRTKQREKRLVQGSLPK